MKLIGPDGQQFFSFQELARERDRFAHELEQAIVARDAERQRAEKMAQQLKALGVEPTA